MSFLGRYYYHMDLPMDNERERTAHAQNFTHVDDRVDTNQHVLG